MFKHIHILLLVTVLLAGGRRLVFGRRAKALKARAVNKSENTERVTATLVKEGPPPPPPPPPMPPPILGGLGGGKGPPTPPPLGGLGGLGGGKKNSAVNGGLLNEFLADFWKRQVDPSTDWRVKKGSSGGGGGGNKPQQAKGKLKDPVDNDIAKTLNFYVRNAYFAKKMKQEGMTAGEAITALITHLCTDVDDAYTKDECSGMFSSLSSMRKSKGETEPYWTREILPFEEQLREFQKQEVDLKHKLNNHVVISLALMDLHPTHSETLGIRQAYDSFMSSVSATEKSWEQILSTFDKVLGDPGMQASFLNNCRVMPAMLDMEHQVPELDCHGRLSPVVTNRAFPKARCAVLAGEQVWESMGIEKKFKNNTAEDEVCKRASEVEWTEKGVVPFQEAVACARIRPLAAMECERGESGSVLWVDGPRFEFCRDNYDDRRYFLYANPTQFDQDKRVFEFDSAESNTWAKSEEDVRVAFEAFTHAVAAFNEHCTTGSDQCATTKAAAEKLQSKIGASLGVEPSVITDREQPLFLSFKERASKAFAKYLKNYRCYDMVFEAHEKNLAKKKAVEKVDAKNGKVVGGGPPPPPPPPPGLLGGGQLGGGRPPPPPPPPPPPGGNFGNNAPRPPPPPPPPPIGGRPPPPPIAPPMMGGGRPPPPPPMMGGGLAAPNVQSALPKRDFKPKKHSAKEEDIPVWTWMGEAVKLWRLIFDDSRKEGKSLVQQWLESNKYHKCAMLGRCLHYPATQRGIDSQITEAKRAYKEAKDQNKPKDEWRRLKAKADKLAFEGGKQKEYFARYCGNDERDADAPGCGICKKQAILFYKKQVKGEIDVIEDHTEDFETMLVVWCEPTVQGLKEAVVYAAMNDRLTSKESFETLTDRVVLRWKMKDKFETMSKDAQAKKLWTTAPDKAGSVVASGIAK